MLLRRLAVVAAVALVQAQIGEDAFDDLDGLLSPPAANNRVNPDPTSVAQNWVVYDLNGNVISPTAANFFTYMPYGSSSHTHVTLNIQAPNNVVVNNLGGAGPLNGSFAVGAFGGIGNAANQNQPNFMQFSNIATVGAQTVALRVDNTSLYKPDRPQQNRKFNNFLIQVNMHPIQDFANAHDIYDIASLFPAGVRPLIPAVVTAVEKRTGYTNQLNLFYSFFDQATGVPIELEEFAIVFYDFDQDWADGSRAYVRESVMVSDFTSMMYRPGSEEQLDFIWSSTWEGLLPPTALPLSQVHSYFGGCTGNSLCDGMLPQYTFTDWPWSEDRRTAVHRPVIRTGPAPSQATPMTSWPTYLASEAAGHGNAAWGFAPAYATTVSAATPDLVMKRGVFILSTTQGTGPAYSPKWYYGGCQGGCSPPTNTVCNMPRLLSSSNNQIPDWWTGCGTAVGYNVLGTSSFAGGVHPTTWNCILDCPRTTVANDYGQPANGNQDPNTPSGDQWWARAVIFMFRNRQNFTVTYRTEVGADNVQLMETNRPDLVRSDLVDQSLQWVDNVQGRRRLRGRNFLVSGFEFLPATCAGITASCLSCCEYTNCYALLHSGTAPSALPLSCQVAGVTTGGTASAACMPSIVAGGAGICEMPAATIIGSCCTPQAPPPPPPPPPSPPPPSPPPPLVCGSLPSSCLSCCEYAHCYTALTLGTAPAALPNDCQTPAGGGTAAPACMPSVITGGAGICEMPGVGILPSCCSPSTPPPSPPPPSPTPVPPGAAPPPATTTCTACSDPHLALAHGGRADFRGEHKAWYAMLSAKNISFNALFEHDDFKNPYKLVHGSAMKSVAWVLRTAETGTKVTIEFNATAQTNTQRALVKASGNQAGQWVAHGARAFKLENVKVEMKEKKLVGAGVNGRGKAWHGMALVVSTDKWMVSVWNKPYPNAAANPGKAMLNINIEPLYDADRDVVAPHGLIGQSWDGDGLPTHGLLDDYSEAEVTTKAMGEGAIEGKAADYRVKHALASEFKYNRFDAVKAAHRDTTNLKKASRRDGAEGVGATGDLEEEEEEEE